jgi:hypothetical protein
MPKTHGHSISVSVEQAFYFLYFCYFSPWTDILALVAILTGVGTAEGLYQVYRYGPGEEWISLGNEVRRIE